jgi:predicted PurR-regulated permease PerM
MIPANRHSSQPSPLSGYAYQGSALAAVMFAVVIVACLYFGREVLVPIALAVLMSFVLAPLVGLQRGPVPRSLAAIVVVLIALAAIFS